MGISSLGVGSGLDLEGLVSQLLEAERAPRAARLDAREETIESEISSLGQIKSKLSEFKDAVDDLRKDQSLTGREPTIRNPSEDTEPFTAEASNSALTGEYDITVERLASGTRIETQDAAFASSSESVADADGSLTFRIGDSGESFTLNITAGTTLAQLREQINDAEDNFGITANIINTGTDAGGAKLVINSDITGEGNDLNIINNNDIAGLNRLATTNSTETTSLLSPTRAAQNAQAIIDGITVQSDTNKFENTIQNVTFTAEAVSEKDANDNFQSSSLVIGFDEEALEEKIRAFVEGYNSLNTEIVALTRYGESELEDDGALAGDFTVRGIQSGLGSILSGTVSDSALGGLFQIGIELTAEGTLEIGSTDFGLGTGESRLSDALEDNFDEVSKLFTADDGIANKLYDFLDQYTKSNGVLADRETAAKDQRDQLLDDRAAFELRLVSFEETLRGRYLNLDQTVARLQQTSSALLASL
ncbi:flagellar filament capping protein FliD [Glaciecola sp. MH2013]|uniref:flagellar filament capping protein FliD n=1 Tax=Glaciecola sp. MH2013 TaxID=2785524 RepID=UPI00189D1185|nr:flagellar filament capping protein FliD [Glaciecola sp. MH2013]MBF7072349.1 flagellar filament capping protein FliD [Glaciecola sp. MH2013]